MLDQELKLYKNRLLDKILPDQLRTVAPSVYSIAGLLIFIPVIWLIIAEYYLIAIFVFTISRICDGLDGFVAFEQDLDSSQGEILDQFIDLIVYGTFILAIVLAFDENLITILGMTVLIIYYVNMYVISTYEKYLLSSSIDPSLENNGHRPIVEGTETLAFYAIFLLFPDIIVESLSIFIALLIISMLRHYFFLYELTESSY